MTLKQIIDLLTNISSQQPAVNSVSEGNVYEALNANPSQKYYNIHITQTNHRTDLETDVWCFNIFCTDRLEDNEANRVQIQSNAIEILKNIIRTFIETVDATLYEDIIITPYTEHFKDYCAGAYVQIKFSVPESYTCEEVY